MQGGTAALDSTVAAPADDLTVDHEHRADGDAAFGQAGARLVDGGGKERIVGHQPIVARDAIDGLLRLSVPLPAGRQYRCTVDRTAFQAIDRTITGWLAEHGLTLLRISIGVVFVWFGMLKFWPGLSPADRLATDTIDRLSFGLIDHGTARILLATLETAIGIGLVAGKLLRTTLLLLVGQMLGTVTPLFLFPELTWSDILVPTLEGQYILKNIVLVSAALTIGATVRGGRLVDDPGALIGVANEAAERRR